MGNPVLHIGPLGSAAVIKVITNMLAFIHLVACGEALMLAKRGGLDLAQAFYAIKASSGTSFVHETEGQLVLNGSYDIGFTMDLALKDLGFAMEFGRKFEVPLAPPKVPIADLPWSYDDDRVVLLARDPRTLFAYWDMHPDTVAADGSPAYDPTYVAGWDLIWKTKAGSTGFLLLIICVLLFGGAHETVRRTKFEIFWYSHHLFGTSIPNRAGLAHGR